MPIENVLHEVPYFVELKAPALEAIAKNCSRKSVTKGEFLVRQGENSKELYIVIQGRFSVLTDNRPIAEVSTGEPVGELAFFTSSKRTADVQALRNSEVLCLTQTNYEKLIKEFPELSQSILKTLSVRLSKATKASEKLRPKAGQITSVLPMTGQNVPERLKVGLKSALNNSNEWAVLDETDLPDNLNQDAASLSNWIREQEEKIEQLVLICTNATANELWYSAILEFCDVTFLTGGMLADTTTAPEIGPAEKLVFTSSRENNIHLIIHRENQSERITNSSAWLKDRDFGMHHHLAMDQPSDLARIVRFIKGEALGLVLCGGGAYGTAHLGAIKAMQERGIVFDMVGGTSIGAANAAALGMELDPSEAINICEAIFLKNKAMGRFTVPLYGIIDHKRLDDQLHQHLGDCIVEDMPINYFSVATSLTTNDVKTIRNGPLVQAVRASSSLPAIFPPFVADNGEVLVDGGLLDNAPISIMRDLKAGPNVIFNFKYGNEWRSRGKYEDLPGRWGAVAIMLRLRKKVHPRFPSIFSVLTRAMVVSARRLMEKTDISGDILIEMAPLKNMGFLEWKKGRQQFEVAYEGMNATLDDIGLKAPAETTEERRNYITKLQNHFSGETSQ